MPVQNSEIAVMFDQTADLLEIKGENQFRVRAYRRAARTIEGLPQSVRAMLAKEADLSELPGIGKDLAGKIADIVASGHFTLLDQSKRKLPGELGEMAALPGLGPKRIKLLYDKAQVRTLDDLRKAIRVGKLHGLHGFGPVIEKKLAAALEKPAAEKRFRLSVAEAEADALVAFLSDKGRVVVAGSFRRRRETVGDLDLLVTSATPKRSATGSLLMRIRAEVLAHGRSCTAVILRSGLQVDLRVVAGRVTARRLCISPGQRRTTSHFAASRWRGVEAQRIRPVLRRPPHRRRERRRGLRKARPCLVPPEMREDRGEVALAKGRRLPKLVTSTTFAATCTCIPTGPTARVDREMAGAAQARGYHYMALTDHSRRQTMSHGLDPARVAQQIREVDKLNAKLKGFTILKGIEVDILKDGGLDLPDSTLEKLDVVVAVSALVLRSSRDAQTERVIRAMQNPYVSIIGHPTGRLIGTREPYEIDMDQRDVGGAPSSTAALEINAEPDRLDLNDLHAHVAKSKGVKVAISTDAHSVYAFKYMRFGIDQARRGWLTADDVINTRPLAELKTLLQR